MVNFTLRQLEVFVMAAEYGSFTRAAEALYLNQSSVSVHISALERALGLTLFHRESGRRVTLTDEGRRVLLVARDLLTRCEQLESGLPPEEAAAPPLVLAASTVPAHCLLPGLMSSFARDNPRCRFLLRRGDSARVHAMLASGEAQLGFVGAMRDEGAFCYERLCDDRLVLVTEAAPRFSDLSPAEARAALLHEPFLAREEHSGTWQTTAAWLRAAGLSPDELHIVARMESPESISRAVAGGLGVSIQSAMLCADDVASGRLRAFDLAPGGVRRPLYLVRRRETPLMGALARFARHCLTHREK